MGRRIPIPYPEVDEVRWFRWRQRRAQHAPRRNHQVWADLVYPDEVSRQAAALAAELRAEAEQSAGLAAALNEPTMIIHEQVRIPPYLRFAEEDGW